MEKLKTLRVMIWVIVAIIASQILLLLAIVRPSSTLLWLVIAMIVILIAYLVVISLGLLKLLNKNNPNK